MAEGARVVRAYGHPGSARTRARPPDQGTPGRPGGGRTRARAARWSAAAARSPDRAPAPGPGFARLPRAGRHGGARRRDEALPHRGLRGGDVLRPFRRARRRRPSPAASHRPGLRLAHLRDDGRGCADRGAGEERRGGRPHRARALHRCLRPRAGGGGRPQPDVERDAGACRHRGRRGQDRTRDSRPIPGSTTTSRAAAMGCSGSAGTARVPSRA